MIPVRIAIEKSGGNLVFSPRNVKKLNYANSVSLDGDQVQSNQAEIVISQSPDSWASDWSGINRNNAVWIYVANRTDKYFFKQLVRIGRDEFRLTVQSPVGRIISKHPGGLYDGRQNLIDVISDVIGGAIPFTCDPALAGVKVYGWAPYQARRKTLQDLMFAYGFIILRDANQNLYFTVPPSDSYAMPRNAIYIGGSVDYRTGSKYVRADVTTKELYADSNAETKTLFDNTGDGIAASDKLITFDSPVHSLSVSGTLAIQKDSLGHDKAGVNYAIVSGVGTLSGKPYTIMESVISVDGDANADPENALSVSNAAFITSANAVSVAKRLLGVRHAVAMSVSLRRTVQRPGDLVTFTDPFGDQQTGYIISLNGDVTSIDKAAAEIICGYAPVWGNDYDNVIILTDSGTWAVPNSIDGQKVRVILIGGGTGGASGRHGSDNAASGGGHGEPGDGGKIHEIFLTVNSGDTFAFACGTGGAGGVASDSTVSDESGEGADIYVTNPGSAGSATTFTPSGGVAYSSADGAHAGVGFYDIVSGVRYAAPGPDNGVDGGAAASGEENGDSSAPQWINVVYPTVETAGGAYVAGGYGGGRHETSGGDEPYQAWAYGGLGGGAAVGANGGDGADARDSNWGGRGGDGADALPVFPADTRAYGSGGSGGHGGGEGGYGGKGYATGSSQTAYEGSRGDGGDGSNGQQGKNGCILIYYKSH